MIQSQVAAESDKQIGHQPASPHYLPDTLRHMTIKAIIWINEYDAQWNQVANDER